MAYMTLPGLEETLLMKARGDFEGIVCFWLSHPRISWKEYLTKTTMLPILRFCFILSLFSSFKDGMQQSESLEPAKT